MNLLIIEDNVAIAQELAGLLGEWGHEVCGIVGDAETGLRLANRDRPDLVIVDVDLGGGGDGISAAIQIRETTNARAIFLTGCDDPATRNRAQQAWPLGFLTKPFDAGMLERKLAGVTGMLESPFAQQFLIHTDGVAAAQSMEPGSPAGLKRWSMFRRGGKIDAADDPSIAAGSREPDLSCAEETRPRLGVMNPFAITPC